MIFFFLLLFFIPVYLRFKGSDELFHNKIFALFLIWFSRVLTYFLMYHVIEHFAGTYGVYALPLFVAYSLHRVLKERILYAHSYGVPRERKSRVKTESVEAVEISA